VFHLPQNIRTGWKGLPGSNMQDCYNLNYVCKKFYEIGPRFESLSFDTDFPARLSLSSVGKARRLPSSVAPKRCFYPVGYGLPHKH
jgi:hypothetical protein